MVMRSSLAYWAYGPSNPKDEIETLTRSGLSDANSSLVKPCEAASPGPGVSTSTSQRPTKRFARSRPASLVTSTVTDRLLRFTNRSKQLTISPDASRTVGSWWRIGSPDGGSMRTTSAPRSARRRPQYAPDASVASTTTTPSSGCDELSLIFTTEQERVPAVHHREETVVPGAGLGNLDEHRVEQRVGHRHRCAEGVLRPDPRDVGRQHYVPRLRNWGDQRVRDGDDRCPVGLRRRHDLQGTRRVRREAKRQDHVARGNVQ